MKTKLFLWAITFAFITLSGYVFIKIGQTNNSAFATINADNNKNPVSIYKLCEKLDTVTFDNFPYQNYLKNLNFSDIYAIEKNITELDSLTKNGFASQNILSNAFTGQPKPHFDTSNLDSLNMILNLADEYRIYAKFSKAHSSLFESIADFWYSNTVTKLNAKTEQNKKQKYDFKYRFLIQRCANNNYFKSQKKSLPEKVLLNIIDQKWAYLIHRFWNSTSILFKTVLLTLFLISIFITFISFKNLFTKKQKTL